MQSWMKQRPFSRAGCVVRAVVDTMDASDSSPVGIGNFGLRLIFLPSGRNPGPERSPVFHTRSFDACRP